MLNTTYKCPIPMLCFMPMPCPMQRPCPWSMPWPMLCPWLISMHKFIHSFAQYNIQMPNTNAVTVPIFIAIAEPLRGRALGQSQCTNSFIILLNTTYKCPMLMLHPLLLPLPRLCPLLMPTLCHFQSCAHGQFQYTDSFIHLLNTTYKCLIPMPSHFHCCGCVCCRC